MQQLRLSGFWSSGVCSCGVAAYQLGGMVCVCVYSRSQKVGNPIASILKSSNVYGIPALFGLNPVSNFLGFTVGCKLFERDFGCWAREFCALPTKNVGNFEHQTPQTFNSEPRVWATKPGVGIG